MAVCSLFALGLCVLCVSVAGIRTAKEQRLRLFKEYKPPSVSGDKEFEGQVTCRHCTNSPTSLLTRLCCVLSFLSFVSLSLCTGD